jgi:nicotinamide-nucleotide amidase
MDAEVIAVGSELLTPHRLDTNSLFLTDQLNALGVEVTGKCVVGDDRARLAAAITAALGRSGIILITGGLGPTEDDVTRDAVGLALGRGQTYNPEIFAAILERFRRMGRAVAENNRRQAMVLDGAEVLPNPNGTAPGQWLTQAGRHVILLPGPPKELEAMFHAQCLPRLLRVLPPMALRTLTFRVAGMAESDLDHRIAPAYTEYTDVATTVLAGAGDITVHLRARAADAAYAERRIAELGAKVEAILGDRIYSRNGDSLEIVVGDLLRGRGETVSVAESCTGGLVAERLTSVPGASDYFLGGFLTYTDAIKARLLGVAEELLREHTAVSEPVAAAMAAGARERAGSTWAVSVTGVAGPAGGTEATPVGTVFIGIAGPSGASVQRFRYIPDRERVRMLAAQSALDLLRRALI